MKLTIKTKLILFTLGAFYHIMNKKLESKHLIITLSKKDFISLLKKSGIVEKKERALYKNLETLEKKKYLKYENKCISFTEKGEKKFIQIEKEIKPYLKIIDTIKKKDIAKYTKQQTKFESNK